MPRQSVLEMPLSRIYPLLVQKAERKGRTKAEVDTVICWLTGYDEAELERRVQAGIPYGMFFEEAPQLNPARMKITGSICGVRVEEIEDPMMRDIRCLDKLVDELARGRSMEKILRA